MTTEIYRKGDIHISIVDEEIEITVAHVGALKSAEEWLKLACITESRPKVKVECIPLPDSLLFHEGFNTAFYQEWLPHLRAKKNGKKVPETTLKRHIAKFEKWGPEKSILAIHAAIEGNWSAPFEPKLDERLPTQQEAKVAVKAGHVPALFGDGE